MIVKFSQSFLTPVQVSLLFFCTFLHVLSDVFLLCCRCLPVIEALRCNFSSMIYAHQSCRHFFVMCLQSGIKGRVVI